MIENNNFLWKVTTYQNTGWENQNAFVIFVLQKIPIYFTKTVLTIKSNATFNMKEVDLDEW